MRSNERYILKMTCDLQTELLTATKTSDEENPPSPTPEDTTMAERKLTVADVYEHAAAIGGDIEHLVNAYGKECIEDVMPKIVDLLETLEQMVEERDRKEESIQQLLVEREKLTIHCKRDEAIKRQQAEKLNYMEELVSGDKKELEKRAERLHNENHTLCQQLEKRQSEVVKLKSTGGYTSYLMWFVDLCMGGTLYRFVTTALPGDVEVMVRMKTTIDNQRDQLRATKSEVQAQKKEIEALQEHTTRLSEINETLRKTNFRLEARLKQRTGVDNVDCSEPDDEVVINKSLSFDENLNEISLLDELKDDHFARLDYSEFDHNDDNNDLDYAGSDQLDNNDDHDNVGLSRQNNELIDDSRSSELDSSKRASQLASENSPTKDKPRYTLGEMQSLLEERNVYKIKMMALEEELDVFKHPNAGSPTPPSEASEDYSTHRRSGGVRSLMAKFLGM